MKLRRRSDIVNRIFDFVTVFRMWLLTIDDPKPQKNLGLHVICNGIMKAVFLFILLNTRLIDNVSKSFHESDRLYLHLQKN